MAQPFHAGGAASLRLHELSLQGLGVARAALSRWWDVDFAHLGSLVALVGAAPAAWRLLHQAWMHVSTCVRHLFIASVTIPAGDPLNRSVVGWILAHIVEPRRRTRFFTARTDHGRGGGGYSDGDNGDKADRAAHLRKTRRPVQYIPHWHTVWFWHRGHLFVVTRAQHSAFGGSSMAGPKYDGFGGEDVTVSCLGRSADPCKRLVRACREWAGAQTQFFVVIYSRDRYGLAWKPKTRKPIRRLETVHFDERVKRELVADVRKYLDRRTQRRYLSRSMPYRRGYLFYGPPGTGKSSLSTALAGEFGLDLYEVSIPAVASDSDLEQMFQEVPPQCIVLLEDIDAVWQDPSPRPPRDADRNRNADSSDGGSGGGAAPRSNCTLSGLLNVLDGVGSQEGRIVIMTTNRPEQLDSALIRPGRVDNEGAGSTSPLTAESNDTGPLLSPDSLCAAKRGTGARAPAPGGDARGGGLRHLAAEFASRVPEDTFTPSQLQGFFQLHLDSAADAAASISSWVESELAKRAENEFELVGKKLAA